MAASPQPTLSPADYLAIDRASKTRHEYADGLMVAMSGGSSRHSVLIASLARLLGNALADGNCAVSVTELRLQVAQGAAYLFPDLMVICGGFQYSDGPKDTLTNPTVIVEVLSDSTERWDRVGKFTQYRRVNGLREYVLVSQDEMLVEWYTRRDNDDWVYRQAAGPDAICHLEQLAVDIPVANLYRKITFPEL